MSEKRDLFIDFLKGLCIICVVLTHNLPQVIQRYSLFVLWGDMAVPLFLTLQAYHVFKRPYKSSLRKPIYNFRKVARRILLPFIVITGITGLLLVLAGHAPQEVIRNAVVAGGIGPGSYYIWIYLQFFLLLPLCSAVFNNKLHGGGYFVLLFVLVSQCAEWLCMVIDISAPIYRLSCFRYLFLIYFGYVWTTNGMCRSLTAEQMILAILSALVLLAFHFTECSLEPFFYDEWRVFHWICYFYAALLLPWLIWRLFEHVSEKIKNDIAEIGRWSYEIFLFQMLVFSLYPQSWLDTGNVYVNVIIRVVFTTMASIIPVVAYKRWRLCSRHTE